MSAPVLSDLYRCFQGILPSVITTCSADGVPNISAISQAFLIDDRHVALSCQFFNKTRANLLANPQAEVEVLDPLDLQGHRLSLRFLRSETAGPLFEGMSLRLDAIAALSGMQGVFKLRSADVFEVQSVAAAPGMMRPATEEEVPLGTPTGEGSYLRLRGLQILAQRINRAGNLDELLEGVFGALAEAFGYQHGMVLMPDGSGQRLVTVASHGYGASGVGAEVTVGEGLIGAVAQQRRVVRVGNVGAERHYHRAIRERAAGQTDLRPEIPLPGLPDARSQVVLPLQVGDQLVGVLFLESAELLAFDQWTEPLLDILAHQVALGIDRLSVDDDREAPITSAATPMAAPTPVAARPRRTFTLFRSDDCVFVDGQYLIRNVPALMLWKLLTAHRDHGQTEFSNRELRLDPALKLPALRDNLESRLILLRKRLEDQCPDVRLRPVSRGRFALDLTADIDLVEKP